MSIRRLSGGDGRRVIVDELAQFLELVAGLRGALQNRVGAEAGGGGLRPQDGGAIAGAAIEQDRAGKIAERLRLRGDGLVLGDVVIGHGQVAIDEAVAQCGDFGFLARQLVVGLAVGAVVDDGADAARGDVREIVRRELRGDEDVVFKLCDPGHAGRLSRSNRPVPDAIRAGAIIALAETGG